jgi:hypothetical protein
MAEQSSFMKYWPVLVVAAGAISSGAVDNFRISANAQEIADLGESVDENEDDIEAIQRLLIQRQGEVELKVQRIENEQRAQGADLDKILLLLQQMERAN